MRYPLAWVVILNIAGGFYAVVGDHDFVMCMVYVSAVREVEVMR